MQDKGELTCDTKKMLDSIAEKVAMPDLLDISRVELGGRGAFVITFDGMVNQELLAKAISAAEYKAMKREFKNGYELFNFLHDECFLTAEKKVSKTLEDCYTAIVNGFSIILIENCAAALKLGTQNIPVRAINEPTANNNIKGAKEAFTESVKTNEVMIRRRLHSPNLRMEEVFIGKESKTKCSIVYMEGRVSKKVLSKIRALFEQNAVDMVLETGVFEILLRSRQQVLFSHVHTTDRPDMLCARIYQGRVGIIVDGTPFVIVVPYLFGDNFQNLDDYNYKAVYINFLRILRMISFLIAIFAPAVHVAACTFTPDLLPPIMVRTFLSAQSYTPFPILYEMLVITMLYEIMREAGLRLPKEVGHTVSIVGSIIIGETAVNGGLISAPTVLIAAIVSIATYIVPSLLDTVITLRIVSLFAAGFFGFWGLGAVMLVCGIILVTKKNMGIRYISSVFPIFKNFRQPIASQDIPPLGRSED